MMGILFVRFLVRCLVLLLYRVRQVGRGNVPSEGPALLVSNHVSFMDGFIVGWGARHRQVRFMLWKPYYDHWFLGFFAKALCTIPVDTNGPRGMVQALKLAREQLEAGHVVCIYAEGSVTRTGHLLPFKRGMEKILEDFNKQGRNIPVIPVHLDRVWGSYFSFARGKIFEKSRRVPRHVTVSYGEPLPSTVTAPEVRQAVSELGSEAFAMRQSPHDTLPERFIRMVRSNWDTLAMADSTGKELTYGRTLTAALLLSDYVKRAAPEKNIGVLLPSTVGGALANLGVALAGKTAANLNFTAGKEGMAYAMREAGIRTVLTSKAFLHKAKLDEPEGSVYLEDLMKQFGGAQKLIALIKARIAPVRMLTPKQDPQSVVSIIFSSGSTGVPKGVMLSHFNLVSNIEGVLQVIDLYTNDRIIGCLPFFHSFGYMVSIWLPLLAGCGVVYHPVPTDAKTIGELIEKYKGTFLISTPTFCQAFLRKCTREQFSTLRFVVVGAEKLREPLRQEFREAFGIELLEGYGTTELSPVVSVNTPDFREGKEIQIANRHGTVGIPIPGVSACVVDPDTRERLPFGQPGMLLIRGPNRMVGYLNQPEKTADVFHGPWYITGDVAAIDEDGFIRITDRLSRFSKIGGEMVPHLRIEEVAAEITGAPCAVTGIPDERKGERLALLYTATNITPEELWRKLSDTDLPNLWIPKKDLIRQVESLPVLGSGKLDLRSVKARALELVGAESR